MDQKIDLILANTTATRNELADYRTANDSRVNIVENQVGELLNRIAKLETSSSASSTNLEQIVSERELVKQIALKNNFCIHGVPRSSDENAIHIVEDLCNAIKYKFSSNKFLSAYRTKASDKYPGLIVVKCSSAEVKSAVMAAKMKLPRLGLEGAVYGGRDRLIFVNHHLTPFYSKLLYKAKMARINGFFVSERINTNGIALRKHDDTIINVRSIAELEQAMAGITPLVADPANLSSGSEDFVQASTVQSDGRTKRKPTKQAQGNATTSKKSKNTKIIAKNN